MKNLLYIFSIAMLLGNHNAYSQKLGINDLLIMQKTNDIQLCNYFLRRYKGFTYNGSLGKDNDNCEVYKWANSNHIVTFYDCLNFKEGKEEKVFFFTYQLPVSEILYFQESLRSSEYKLYQEFTSGDGFPMAMWKLSSSTKISAVMIEKKGDYFEITSP